MEPDPPVEDEFQLYVATDTNNQHHCLLRAPRSLPQSLRPANSATQTQDAFNILMADCSGSMCSYWSPVVVGWQEHVKDKLSGRTKIFVFGSTVDFIRKGTDLNQSDNRSGTTDLTSALRVVRREVDSCSEQYVRVFIVTDGQHCHGDPQPDTEIDRMRPPKGKTVEVFLLGIGYYFPVNYSIDLHSRMHNGSANLPSLFWAKDIDEIVDQLMAVGAELSAGQVTLALNHQGHILPGLDKTETIHLGEWLYFVGPPEDLPSLTIKVDEEEPKPVSAEVQELSMRLLLDQVFRQWNSVFIQQHRRKEHVPHETFDLMDSLFKNIMNELNADVGDENNLKTRLNKKRVKSYEVAYKTLMNPSKTVIGVEGKYRNEIELAETILKSTVTTRKYDTKNLKLKGHGAEDYETDIKIFRELYEKAKQNILELPAPTPEECCRITMTSTLQDLQDEDFHLMFDESKFDLLKSFTMTGIPIYAPVRDSSQINPWTLGIKQILVTPFTVLSQRAIELYAESGDDSLGAENKDVLLQKDNVKTRFNAIIPIVPARAASVLKSLVRSNLYAMLATFCILKNPHIIDYNAHIAALGCAWVRSVSEFPVKGRPEFVCDRLKNIVATADLYMDREGITRYLNALINNPKQALMTESMDQFDGHTLKCESLIKPIFFLNQRKKKLRVTQIVTILRLVLTEFLGRCLSNYKADDVDASPFTDFFANEVNDPARKKAWLEKHCQNIIASFKSAHGELLEKFFAPHFLRDAIKEFIKKQLTSLAEQLSKDITIQINMGKVKSLRNNGSCGDIRWSNFRSWAQEMGLRYDKIEEAFSESQVLVYVVHALTIRNSKERLSKDLSGKEEALELVRKKVTMENTRTLRTTVMKVVEEFAVGEWHKAYTAAHTPLVMPMTRGQIIEAAQARGIEVTEETFGTVYRYDIRLRLLRNACQLPSCPHYLQSHNTFNQHIAIERQQANFPHALHVVTEQYSREGIERVVQEVVSSIHAGRQERPKPPALEPSSLDKLSKELNVLLQEYTKGETRE